MTITRFSPFHDVAVLQNRLNSIFNDFPRTGTQSDSESLSSGSFVPAVDVYEDAHKLVLTLEVPGIRPENVDIHVENNTLTVKGERSFSGEQKEQNFHRIERRFGSFVRSFTLPQSVDTESVKANYEQGVLEIELPKKAEAKPKQIKVEVSSVASQVQPRQVEAQVEQPKAA